jgi:prepilin-type N-terminal cleavage/methylation domain-containing protein
MIEILQARDLPLLARRGGPSDIKRYRVATTSEAGWWVKHKQRILCWTLIHHPVCAAKESGNFLTGAEPSLLSRRDWSRSCKSLRGFSLIEVLVATAITVGVGSIVFQLFHQNERIFRDEAVRVEMQQTARLVVSQIGDDIRIAGQGIPPALGDVVLPGSSGQRLNIRTGFSTTETIVTTAPPVIVTLGTPLTLKVENTSGFSTGKHIFIWNAAGWLRANVDSVSGSAKTIALTPSAGSGPSVQFDTPPTVGLDEAIALYLDSATSSVRRTTSTNTTDPGNPVWAPANEIATNVSGLDFLYFDRAGAPLIPDTPENRTKIASIEARVRIRPAAPVAGGTQPVFSLSVRAQPRNLQYR